MMADADLQKYSLWARIFHWVGALLIVAAVISINTEAVALHKSIGASFLLWTLARVMHALVMTKPKPVMMPRWQKVAAHLTHGGLYVLMLAMPITGVLMSMYGGRGVSVFGIFELPVLVAPDRELSSLMNGIHTELVFPAMLLLIVLHIGAALYHQFMIKDDLLKRMI